MPVFKQIYAHFHDLCNHIQAHMHFSGSSYLPVFACIFVCICLYLPISVSLMRRQRARDSESIVILSRSRSRRDIHSRLRAAVQTKSLSRVQGATRRTFGILLVLELALDDLGLGATALGCDYILASSNQHHFVRSYSVHDNTNENSECS